MQKLIQPLNYMKVTASYKNAAYRGRYGYQHYGVDCTDIEAPFDRTLYSLGNGTIVDFGVDSVLGLYVVLKYPQSYNHKRNTAQDLIVRMFHLNYHSDQLVIGRNVTKDFKIGEYGGSGYGKQNYWDKHLHIEVDTDTKYTHYTPTLSKNSNHFFSTSNKPVSATDSTMSNPLEWIHTKTNAPDFQVYLTTGDSYINTEDKTLLPLITKTII